MLGEQGSHCVVSRFLLSVSKLPLFGKSPLCGHEVRKLKMEIVLLTYTYTVRYVTVLTFWKMEHFLIINGTDISQRGRIFLNCADISQRGRIFPILVKTVKIPTKTRTTFAKLLPGPQPGPQPGPETTIWDKKTTIWD